MKIPVSWKETSYIVYRKALVGRGYLYILKQNKLGQVLYNCFKKI